MMKVDSDIPSFKPEPLGWCSKFLDFCPFFSRVEVINGDPMDHVEMSDRHIIDFKSKLSKCWGRAWECISRNRAVAFVIATLSLSCGIAVGYTTFLYGASLGTGTGVRELFFDEDTDFDSDALGQYVLTPLVGLVTICAAAIVTGGICLTGCVTALRYDLESSPGEYPDWCADI